MLFNAMLWKGIRSANRTVDSTQNRKICFAIERLIEGRANGVWQRARRNTAVEELLKISSSDDELDIVQRVISICS
jgi:hypothetical protein